MPEGQTSDAPKNSEGQYTAPGSEQQGPLPRPATNSEGQQTCDVDGDGAEQQDGDLLSTHPSSGGFPNTQATIGRGAHLSGGMPAMKRTNF